MVQIKKPSLHCRWLQPTVIDYLRILVDENTDNEV
jgi:hypothetical protein